MLKRVIENRAVRVVDVPGEELSCPSMHDVYARHLSLMQRLRYPIAEAAWLLAISERQLRYHMEAGDIHPQWDGDKPLFTLEELKRYCRVDHPSPRKSK